MARNTEIGKTGLRVPPLCFGTSGLGSMPGTYGYAPVAAEGMYDPGIRSVHGASEFTVTGNDE